MDGIRSGKSAYENYTWKPDLTIPMTNRLIEVMGIQPGESLMDFGCSRGYVVKALIELGIDAWGYDISEWAVNNCDPAVKHRVHTSFQQFHYDHFFCKDCAEHIEPIILADILKGATNCTRKSLLIIVPLTEKRDGKYLRKEDNLDATHVIRWPLQDWMSFIQGVVNGEDFTVSGSWHIPGLKPTSLTYLKSCGFIQLRKNHAHS